MTVQSAAQIVGDKKIVIINGNRKLGCMTPMQVENSEAFEDVQLKEVKETQKAVHFYI